METWRWRMRERSLSKFFFFREGEKLGEGPKLHRAPSVLLLGGLPLLPLKMWSGLFGGDGRTAQTNKMTGEEKKEQDSKPPPPPLLRLNLGCGGIIPLLSLSSFSTRLPRYSSSS